MTDHTAHDAGSVDDTGEPSREGTEQSHSPPREGSTVGRLFWLATRAIQIALVGIAAYALFASSEGGVFNVILPLAIALLPDIVRYRTGWRFNPVLAAWIAAAAFLHATGSLGAYTAVPAYDQIAHGFSAALVAGVGYALVRTVDNQYENVVVPPNLRFVFILVFTLAFGAIWEVAEFSLGRAAEVFGGEPLLTQYGLDDTVLDLVFDAAGGVLVAIWGTQYFDGLRRGLGRYVGAGDSTTDRPLVDGSTADTSAAGRQRADPTSTDRQRADPASTGPQSADRFSNDRHSADRSSADDPSR